MPVVLFILAVVVSVVVLSFTFDFIRGATKGRKQEEDEEQMRYLSSLEKRK